MRLTLRVRACHLVKVVNLCRRTRRKTYAYRGACVRLTPGARLFIGSYSQNTCYISVRDIPATLVDVFWRKAARSSHRTRRAYQERTPYFILYIPLNSCFVHSIGSHIAIQTLPPPSFFFFVSTSTVWEPKSSRSRSEKLNFGPKIFPDRIFHEKLCQNFSQMTGFGKILGSSEKFLLDQSHDSIYGMESYDWISHSIRR